MFWAVGVEGESIHFDLEMECIYSGRLDGHDFVVTCRPEKLFKSCPIVQATLTGTFADDFRSFGATEVVLWNLPAQPAETTRRWYAVRQ